jgi:ligand-binding sensor domain-containing protein
MKYYCRKIFYSLSVSLFAVFLVSFVSLSAQTPYFRQIATIDDFGEGQIKCIYQDKQGFIWIGATSGAYRFDGQDFISFILPDSLLNKSVTAIHEDSKGILWFGFEDGNMMTYDRFQVTGFRQKNTLPNSKITSIIEDQNHDLWFGTYGEGLFVYQSGSLVHISAETGLSDDYVYTLLQDKKGNIWAGTDNGISICSIQNGKPVIRILTVENGLPDFIVPTMKTDEAGKIWIGMQDKGITCYNPEEDRFENLSGVDTWKYGSINDLVLTGGSVWIATNGNGLVECDPDLRNFKTLQHPGNLNLNRMNSMLVDLEGNTWLISNKEILLSFGKRLEFLSSYRETKVTNIHAIFCDPADNLWFANDNGLYRYKTSPEIKGNRLTQYPITTLSGKSKIMSLYEDFYGFIWIGTFGQGLIRLDPESGNHINISERDGLFNGNVLSIKGNSKEIWFATLGGAFSCKIDERFSKLHYIPQFKNFGQAEGLGNNFIYNIFIDRLNRVWLATDGSGICYYQNEKFINIPDDSTFRDKVIYSVTVDANDVVWMNVANEGIFKYTGKELVKVFVDEEHKNLSFSGIIANHANELVISYASGVDVMNLLTNEVTHFEGNAGLSDINPDPNVISIDSRGNVWIGTEKGILKYSPVENITWKQPQSHITDVNIYLEKTNHILENDFTHNQNHLSFSYSGLWYQYPEQVNYQIRLSGHDLGWINTRNNNVIYSNLSPGNYTFEVKAALYENFENATIASYSFTINQPFWNTIWFYIILITLTGIGIYFYIKIREKRIEKKQEILREKIRFQFENLKSQINPHFLFNSFSTLIALIDQDQEAAIEYVEELSSLFRIVLEYKDQDLITLEEELSIISNYFNLQKKRYGENLSLTVEKFDDIDKLMVPPLTLQLLIENAIKHNIVSKDNPLQIKIYTNPEEDYIFVKNNLQPKKEEVKSMGIGIRNIADRYNLLSEKKIKIIKTLKDFTVGLPFIYRKNNQM